MSTLAGPIARALQRPMGRAAAIALVLGAAGVLAWQGLRAPVPPARPAPDARTHCELPRLASAAPRPGMVWVPAGSFEFGDDVYREEQPIRTVSVKGFWMDRTEVTNAEFAAFVKATGYVTVAERPVDARAHPGLPPAMAAPGAVVFTMPVSAQAAQRPTDWWRYVAGANWRHPGGPQTGIEGRDAFPVVAVTIEDARAYARWAGNSLPTEAQWEWAARAGQPRAGQDHEQPRPDRANTWQGLFPMVNSGDDGFIGLAPVGCYPANSLGLFDLIGNVWELTADAWVPDHSQVQPTGAPDQVPAIRSPAPAQRVIKGGSYLCAPNYCMRYRSGSREPQDDDLATGHLGFRTVRMAPGPGA